MMMLQFTIPISPVPKGRPRLGKFGTYTPPKTKKFEDDVKLYLNTILKNHDPLETPIEVFLYFRLPIPKSYSKKRTEACLSGSEKPILKNGDLDNYAKAVLDAFNGIVYKDDCQIVEMHLTKVYDSQEGIDCLIKEC